MPWEAVNRASPRVVKVGPYLCHCRSRCQQSQVHPEQYRLPPHHHLAFETVEEHSNYSVLSKTLSIHSVMLTNKLATSSPFTLIDDLEMAPLRHPERGQSKTNQSHIVV
ncbi:hypothetical protein ZIOFF_003954 [Zingiber officinale]|uniref:Uncharacterized protein n=1 Tax=Zingiber officinale TaxID=94328 RepID=A0A8J5I9J1_ZINOF|nr:hypothetical protein ZIOFF_003954 [Zingiber officinale]